MDGGLRGGGYGPTFIFCTSPPMNSRAAAVAAASTASATTSLVGAALANAAAADASTTSDTTRSALRAFVRFAIATEHDLQFTVCAKYRSSSSSLVAVRGGRASAIPSGHAGEPPAMSTIQRRNAAT